MDYVGIVREQANGKPISLGHRLKQYENTNPKTANLLTAIKWIGNESSHITGVTKEGVLAIYELLEHSLDTIFPDRENRLIELSNQINTKKEFNSR